MHSLQMEFLKQMYFLYLHMHTFSCVCTFEGQNYIVRQHSIWFQFALSSGFHQASRSYMFFLQLTCDHLVSEHDLLLKARDANLAILKSMVKDPMLRYPPQEELLLQR